ncbi:peptidase C48, SUMO/sentrin/Ubl1, partial [Tanacetum coccineum]
MKVESGGNDEVIDLTQAPRTHDVPGLVVQDCKDEIRRETVGNDGDVGKKERRKITKKGRKETVDEANVTDKGVDEEGVVNKISQKRRGVEHNNNCDKSVVGDETSCGDKFGDEGVVKKIARKEMHKKNKNKGVGCKEPDVDRIHVRVSLWSLHRLIPNLSPQQKKDIIEIGFGAVLDFKIKDVPTRLSYWLLENFNEETCVLNVNGKAIPITRETIKDVLRVPMGSVYVQARDEADFRHRLVVEWKSQFGKMERYYHGPLEQLIYTQTNGGWWFKINFLVLYLTSIGEANKNATCNLRFLHCINDETAIHQFDWCTFILECLILYASSMRTKTIKENVGMPLVNNWTVDMLNKLEDERFNMMNVEEVKKSVAAKFKKAVELIDEAEYALDDALEQNPHDKELIQLRDLRDVLFGSRKYSQPASDSPKENEEQVNEQERTADEAEQEHTADEAYRYTPVYGTPSAYVAYSEQVELEWSNKQKQLRSDNVQVSKFDLNLTEPPPTEGFNTPETLIGVRSIADVSGNAGNIVSETSALTPYNICDAQPLQSIPPQAVPRRTQRNVRPSEVLRSPYVVREVYLCGTLSNHEKRASDCLFSGRLTETDILFKTDSVNGPRGVLETLCPGILISSGVIDIFTKVLNHAELYRDPLKSMRRVFFDTSMMHEWDVKHSSAKEDYVKEAANIFNKNMLRILKTTSYSNLSNVDLVFFPIIQGRHFFVVCMHLKWKEVQILDNISSLVTDVSARYGDVVEYLVA